MLKIGVVGAGHLGRIHIRILKECSFVKLVGFFDTEAQVSKSVVAEYGVVSYASLDDLIAVVDIIDVVTPTLSHFDVAQRAMKQFKHVFIEKPVAPNIQESKKMIALATEANVNVQVGHVERFNPAFLSVVDRLDNPMFIETHRLAQFNPRGTDVSVVLDLMIHDIDIVLSVVNSNVKNIYASGVAIVSDTPDIANARIEFDNGCVANLTASRMSMKNMRKSRFFQKDAYISVDFLTKKNEVIKIKDVAKSEIDPFAITLNLGEKGYKQIGIFQDEAAPNNAIEEELKSFVSSIEDNAQPTVSIHDAHDALKVAMEIIKKIG